MTVIPTMQNRKRKKSGSDIEKFDKGVLDQSLSQHLIVDRPPITNSSDYAL